MAPKQTPPRRTAPNRTAPNRTAPNRNAPNRNAPNQRKPQTTDWQQNDHELPEAPFTGLVVEEIDVEAERKPQRKPARPASAPAQSKAAPARKAVKTQTASQKPARFAEPVSPKAAPPKAASPKVERPRAATPKVVIPEEEISAAPISAAPIHEAPIPAEAISAAAEESLPDAIEPTPTSLPEATSQTTHQSASIAEDEIAEIEDEQTGERLQKLLARAGIASRRRAEELIAEGRVQVNGQVVTEPGSRALMGRDHVRVDGKLVQAAERMRYFLLNKPKGYVTTVSDPEGRPTVMEFFPNVRERVYPVGRLDYLSEGLLLVTNDGPLANGLTRAAHGVEKRYLVKVAGDPDEATIDTLRTGVVIERGRIGSGEGRVRTSPAQIRKVRQGDNPWFEVVLIEGRNRELRKMFEEIGHHVEKIRRVGYGPLELDVEPGKVRELDEDELRLLRLAAEGKWKPKRRREPIALPKEAGRSVRHDRGARDSRGFADKPSPSSASRWTGGSNAGSGTSRPGRSTSAAPRYAASDSAAPRPAWKDRGRVEGERSERPAPRSAGFGTGRSARPAGRSSFNDRPQRGTAADRTSRERDSGERSSGSEQRPGFKGAGFKGPGFKSSGFKGSGFKREGGFTRPSRPAGSGRPADGASRPRYDAGSTEGAGAERNFGKPGASRTGFSKPGFSKPGFSKPGFSKPGFSKPGFSKPGSSSPAGSRSSGSSKPAFSRTGPQRNSKWRTEEEKPQPGGRNSVQRVGPDGKPRDKHRWRDSFEGKSKGKPKWSGKRPGKPNAN